MSRIRSMLEEANLSPDLICDSWRDTPQREGPPLVKAKVSGGQAKKLILEAARKKQFPNGIGIRQDLTFKQREARRKAARDYSNGRRNISIYPTVAPIMISTPQTQSHLQPRYDTDRSYANGQLESGNF